jgi:hypothetical protein
MQYSSFDNSPKIWIWKSTTVVNIAVAENPETVFSMFERTAIKTSPPTTATRWGTARRTRCCPNCFLEREHPDYPERYKGGVYNRSNHEFILPNQNADELKIIMRYFPAVC